MARRIQYRRFLGVRAIEHGGGGTIAGSKPISDLRFRPTPSGENELRRMQLLFKAAIGGFDLLYRTFPLEAEELVPQIMERVRFSFMMLGGRSLGRFADDKMKGPPAAYYFDNLTQNDRIKTSDEASLAVKDSVGVVDRAEIRPPRFDLYAEQTRRHRAPSSYTFRPKGEQKPRYRVRVVKSLAPVVSTRVELPPEPRAYTMTTSRRSDSSRTIYVDDAVRRSKAIGLVELFWDRHQSAVPNGSGLTYRIQFKPASA